MKKISIVGSFGNGRDSLDGQTVKTKIIAQELIKEYGEDEVWCIDTYGRLNNFLSVLKAIWALCVSYNVIMLPAHNALKVLATWLAFWNKLFGRRLHYVVIGGWLDGYLDEHRVTERSLHTFFCIYVETQTMMNVLQNRGFNNVLVLPNCKDLDVVKEENLVCSFTEPYGLVTFSRVSQMKGIEDVVRIVTEINAEAGRDIYTLDIYGPVTQEELEWFSVMTSKYGLEKEEGTIRYRGSAPFYKSVEILSKYFALLFPTRYRTEGIPGTIIDAYAAGVPVISAKWESFADVVDEGVTGIGFEIENWNELKTILLQIAKNPELVNQKKSTCLRKAKDFLPKNALSQLKEKLEKCCK